MVGKYLPNEYIKYRPHVFEILTHSIVKNFDIGSVYSPAFSLALV